MNLYVSNLHHETNEDQLRAFFQKIGEVTRVKIVNDRYTGESKCFGFVMMPNKRQANAAIQQLSNTSLGGHKLVVTKAREITNQF